MTDITVRRGSAVEGGFSYIGAVVAMLLVSVVIGVLPFGSEGTAAEAVSFVGTAAVQLCFLLASVIPYKCTRSRPRYTFSRPSVKAAFAAPAVTVICLIAFYGVAEMFGFGLSAIGYSGSGGADMTSPLGIVAAVITSVILAPVCEESLFRRSHLSSLGVMLGRKRPVTRAVLMTVIGGLVFAFMHCRPEQTVYQFFFGGALVYMTIRTGTIVPAIIAHASNNVIGIVLSVPAVSEGLTHAETAVSGVWYGALAAAVVSVALCVGGIFLLRAFIRRLGSHETGQSFVTADTGFGEGYADDGGTVAGTVFTVLGFAVCVALWTVTLVAGIVA